MEWIKAPNADYANEKTWKPTEPSDLIGKIISKKTVDVGKYGPSVVIKIEEENGDISNVWMNRGGLKDLLEQWDDELTVGRNVGFRMTGVLALPNGNTFYPYEIGFGEQKVGASVRTAAPVQAVDDDEAF